MLEGAERTREIDVVSDVVQRDVVATGAEGNETGRGVYAGERAAKPTLLRVGYRRRGGQDEGPRSALLVTDRVAVGGRRVPLVFSRMRARKYKNCARNVDEREYGLRVCHAQRLFQGTSAVTPCEHDRANRAQRASGVECGRRSVERAIVLRPVGVTGRSMPLRLILGDYGKHLVPASTRFESSLAADSRRWPYPHQRRTRAARRVNRGNIIFERRLRAAEAETGERLARAGSSAVKCSRPSISVCRARCRHRRRRRAAGM
jgi:hypothetical protein